MKSFQCDVVPIERRESIQDVLALKLMYRKLKELGTDA